nr:hypothetical protein [Tanacetum cinerariifolium]
MLEIILHQQRTSQLLKQKKLMQTQEDNSNPIPALNVDSLKVDLVVIQNTCFEKEDNNLETASNKLVKESSLDSETKDVHAIKYNIQMTDKYFVEYTGIEVKHFRDTLLQYMGNVKKSVTERTRHQRQYDRRVNKRQMQMQESNIDTSKAVDANLVVTKSSGTKLEVRDDSSRSGNDTDIDGAYIRLIYDEEPMAEVQLTDECNIFAIRQQHTEQHEIINKVTQNYLPKRRESIFVKPDHVIASSESKNSSKNMSRFSSNDMVYNHYLDEARKKTQERNRNSKCSVMHTASPQNTTKELESLFGPFFDEYFNGENQIVSMSSAVTTADASIKRQQQQDSTSSTSSLPTTVTADGNFDL